MTDLQTRIAALSPEQRELLERRLVVGPGLVGGAAHARHDALGRVADGLDLEGEGLWEKVRDVIGRSGG